MERARRYQMSSHIDALTEDPISIVRSTAAAIPTLRYVAIQPYRVGGTPTNYEWWRISRSSNRRSTPRMSPISPMQGSTLMSRLYCMDRESLLNVKVATIDSWIPDLPNES